MHIGDYENAVMFFNILRLTKDFKVIDKDSCWEVYTRGAEHALKQGDIHLARKRYQSAFSIAKKAIPEIERECHNQLYIVHHCPEPTCKLQEKVQRMFDQFTGLRSTTNHESGQRKIDAVLSTVEKSICVVFLLHRANDISYCQHFLDQAIERYRDKLIIAYEEDTEIDQILPRNLLIHYPQVSSADDFEEDNELKIE